MNHPRVVASVALAAMALLTTGCGEDWRKKYEFSQVELNETKRQNVELEAKLDAAEKAKVDNAYANIPADTTHETVRANLLPGVSESDRPLEHVLSIESSILFAPGRADLTSEAKSTLSRVIAVIHKDYPNHWIRVDGFTDDSPITKSKKLWDDNWDLSGGRAQAVLHYLLSHGVAAADLGFAGFGEERTVAPNTSEENRKKNRRVEIIVIPK